MLLKRSRFQVLGFAFLAFAAACAPAAPASPTTAPAKPAAPATQGSAPSPAAKVAASPGAAASPAAKPSAAASPAAKPAANPAVASFYGGKTLRMIVGYDPGGGYDTTTRVLAKHIGNYIPGKPNVIVENMPGAASLVAANWLYNTAPKDGTAIATFASSHILGQAMGLDGIQFDATKYNWLGSSFASVDVCAIRPDSPVKTFQESLTSSTPIKFASTGVGDTTYAMPSILKEVTGANVEVITGYKGSNDIRLAVERGEVQGICQSWDSLSRSSQFQQKVVVPFVQNSATAIPAIKDVPLAEQFTKNAEGKQMLNLLRAPREIDKTYSAPPGVPAERVQALRDALAATYSDASFLKEAQDAKVEIDPKSAAEVEKVVAELLGTPKDVLQKYKQITGS